MITPILRRKDAIDTWLIDAAGNVAISISDLVLLKRIQRLFVPAFVSTEQAMEWGSHLNPEQLATLLDIHRNLSDAARAEADPQRMVAKNDTLVVEDLARDRRFANNPLIKARGLRFYAGTPVRGVSGFPIGSLCLLDVRPRKMTDHERRVLESFADDLSEEIQHRATEKGAAALATRQSAPAATG